MASGTRLGRIRIARPVTAPVTSAPLHVVEDDAINRARSQQAETGTSLSGHIIMKKSVGLVAIHTAAPTATSGSLTRKASR